MLVVEPTLAMGFTFALIVLAITLFAWERYPIELVGVGILAVMLVVFHLAPVTNAEGRDVLDAEALLAGFAEPALITVLALMVVGQALVRTHALQGLVSLILQATGSHWRWSIWVLLGFALTLSAFINNTPVVVIFIPIMQAVASELRVSPSKIMMPLNMAVILGGMTTLIGSSTNLLAAGLFEGMTGQTVGLFDFTPIALCLVVPGIAYVLLVAPRLLPDRASMASGLAYDSARQYLSQIVVGEKSSLVGKTAAAGMFPGLPDVTVQLVQRGEHAELPPFDGFTLAAGDVLVVAATRKALTDAVVKDPGLTAELDSPAAEPAPDGERKPPAQRVLAEVMVAPASRIVGQNLEMIGFRRQFGCLVIGIQRRSRMIRTRITEIRLEPGDVLLIQGHRQDVRALRGDADFILMEWSQTELPSPHLARRVGLVFLGMLAVIATEALPVVVAAVGAAVLVILIRAVNVRQAARAIDRRIVFLIACSVALSTALEATGGARYIAQTLLDAVGAEASPALALSAYFFVVMAMTNVLSNNATALLFTPVGIGLAVSLGVDPFVFLVATIFASDSSFATPIGYQTNVLIMGPGHYRFVDYVRAGLPLNLLLWIVFSLVAPWYYNLT